MSTLLACVLCGRADSTAVLCRECLARRCACGHPVGDHAFEGDQRCLTFAVARAIDGGPGCPCAGFLLEEVVQ